jgi:3'-phosphoadenosine 5'-phosphosulfate sulfotransferase (PAPS reductase)/FAD synthetase
MDWPCTRDYCRKVADAFKVPLYFSWKVGGFEREMLRDNAATAPTRFEVPKNKNGAVSARAKVVDFNETSYIAEVGGNGPKGIRMKFPQVSPDLSVRWCSAYLKIDVGATALRNQTRFQGARTLFITGERAEESSARAKYKTFEPHRSDARDGRSRRLVDQWRPVHGWSEQQVWDIIERHSVNPHPAYRCGWGRVSCMLCIFGNADQMASAREIAPYHFNGMRQYEQSFGVTIKRKLNVVQVADAGKPYQMDPADRAAAMSATFNEPVILPEGTWKLPQGAFGDSCGPT